MNLNPDGFACRNQNWAETGIRGLASARTSPMNPKMRPKIVGMNCDPDVSKRPPPPNSPPLLATLMVRVWPVPLPQGSDALIVKVPEEL